MQRFLSNTQDIMRYERFLLIMKYTRPNKISLRVRRKFYRAMRKEISYKKYLSNWSIRSFIGRQSDYQLGDGNISLYCFI